MQKQSTEYNTAWAAFQAKWPPQCPVIPYIYETWLQNYKQMIVMAWTNHVLHFGNPATSRVEWAHLVIIDAIHSSCGDLDTVLDHIRVTKIAGELILVALGAGGRNNDVGAPFIIFLIINL
jgi:hypothetical protein